MSEYTCEAIQVLRGLDAVRKRPGMYIGDTTTGAGLHHMVWSLVELVVQDHIAGYASELRVELGPHAWITVHDDGVGIPTEALPERASPERPTEALPERASPGRDEPTNVLELIFSRLHGGYRPHHPHTRIADGFDLPVINALGEELVVETTYQGVRWSQSFARGERVTRLRNLGPARRHGTTIRFRPDPKIFVQTMLDPEHLRRRLEDLARLYPHLRVWFQEQRLDGRGGIHAWARRFAAERGDVVESIPIAHTIGDAHVELALAWNSSGKPFVRSFVNTRPTKRGSHVDGMWSGFCEYARGTNSPARGNAQIREAIGCGLVAVLHVTLGDPRFTSQARDELRCMEATEAVRAAVLARLAGRGCRFLDERLLVDRTRG